MSRPDIRTCPKCGFAQPMGESYCLKCGLVFAKYRQRLATQQPSPSGQDAADAGEILELAEDHIFVTHQLGAKGWLSVAGGGLLALIILMFPRLDFIFQVFITLVHELVLCGNFMKWCGGTRVNKVSYNRDLKHGQLSIAT